MGEREVEAALREAFLAGVRVGRELSTVSTGTNGHTPQTNGQKPQTIGQFTLPLRDPPPGVIDTKEVLTLRPDPDPDPDPEKSTGRAKSRRAGASDFSTADFRRYDFERFWKVYPKKRHKPAAWHAWQAVEGARDLEAILAGVERWGASDAWGRGFVEDPATFLRQRQWEDTPSPTERKPAPCGGALPPTLNLTQARLEAERNALSARRR